MPQLITCGCWRCVRAVAAPGMLAEESSHRPCVTLSPCISAPVLHAPAGPQGMEQAALLGARPRSRPSRQEGLFVFRPLLFHLCGGTRGARGHGTGKEDEKPSAWTERVPQIRMCDGVCKCGRWQVQSPQWDGCLVERPQGAASPLLPCEDTERTSASRAGRSLLSTPLARVLSQQLGRTF